MEGLNEYVSHYNKMEMRLVSPDSIKVNPIDVTFSPFHADQTVEVVVSPYGFESPKEVNNFMMNAGLKTTPFSSSQTNKNIRTSSNMEETTGAVQSNRQIKARISTSRKKKSEKQDITYILKEFNELKNKYTKLEKELQVVKKNKVAGTSSAKKTRTTAAKKKKEISEEEKFKLVADINDLSLTDKKQMRVIIKDYITIFQDGQFNFNINTLPKDVLQELMKFVDKCLKSKGYTYAVVRCFESVGQPDPNWSLMVP